MPVPVDRPGLGEVADLGHRAAEHGAGGRIVGPAGVEDVADEVLRGDLPVALDGRADAAAGELGAALVVVEDHVEVPGHRTEILGQARRIGGEGGEHQALIAVDAGFTQAVLRLVEGAVLVDTRLVHAAQRAIGTEGPAVVVADEAAGVTGLGETHLVAAVRAGVDQHLDRGILLANHQHLVLTHGGGDVVAGLGNLRFVGDEQPAAGEDLLQFLLVDVAIPEDLPGHAPGFHVAQFVEVRQRRGSLDGLQFY
ncbi:hypothetical protein D9M71_551730 [compost metagenome]